MKKHILRIQSILLILAIGLSMNSCSYTKSTGSASNFNKKHYNKGIVKHKSSKKSTTAVLAEATPVEKLSKKEKKEEAKVQMQQYFESQDLMASESGAPIEHSKENILEKIQSNFTESREILEAKKEEATTEKEEKKIDKKIARVSKFENRIGKMANKMEGQVAPDPDAINAAPGGRDLMGLLGGIFGIAGAAFAFVPYLGYLGILLCLSAIVLGALGLSGSNRGWALTGIILGALGLLFFIMAIAIFWAILI